MKQQNGSSKVKAPLAKQNGRSWLRLSIYIALIAVFILAAIPLVFQKETSEYLNKGDWGWVPFYSDLVVWKWCLSLEASPIDHVEGPIYIGNVCAATNLELLKEKNITYILNTCLRCPTRFSATEGMKTLHLKLKDIPEADLEPHMEPSLQFIAEAVSSGSNILIHCAGGKSRSASFVLAHLMKSKGMSYDEALQLLRTKRAIVQPNSGFEKQLRKMSEQLSSK